MNPAKARYALLVAADALSRDEWLLRDLVADDGRDAEMTAPQVIDCLRALALLMRDPAPDPSPEEQAEIDRFGIFAEESAEPTVTEPGA